MGRLLARLTCLLAVKGVLFSLIGTSAFAIPAFPGAEGFGAGATGGRGGEVFHVVNTLNTNVGTYEGPNGYNRGTLRWCLLNETSTAPRTIVFDVSGQVTLTSQITLESSNMTIAGQTAPGEGLTSAGKPWLIESGGNLVIRYIRNRLGRNGGQDSIGVEGGSQIIFDHVTSTWSNDEALSVAKNGNYVTVQNSMIYEGLNHSGHGYGSLIRPDIDSKISYHHNLYANNESRNPRPGTYNSRTLDFDFRNNVIYNWGDRAGYSGGSSEGNPEYVNLNYVGNYVVAGPSTTNNANTAFLTDVNAVTSAYQSGNLIDSDKDATRDGVDTGWGMFTVKAGTLNQLASPHPLAPIPVTTQTAADAYESVLNYAGSFWWNRDVHDARVVNQVRTQTGTLINHESEVGGFLPPTSLTRAANWDTDHDGMPDEWETKHGLNPLLSSDRNNDFDTDGFTNLEEYLNETGAWPAPRAISWNGSSGRYALNQNWDTWQPSRFDEVHINGGVAAVDAIGQQAGLLRIAPNAGAAAQLSVTGGWIEVEDEVVIGTNNSNGTLALSGGALRTPLLSRGSGGTFDFTGGSLSAGTVDFSLVNNGGVIAPGIGIGLTHVTDDLTLNSGAVEFQVGGTGLGEYDQLAVDGRTTLGGTLRVLPIDLGGGLYEPAMGDALLLMTSLSGFEPQMFSDLDLPDLAGGLGWMLSIDGMTLSLSVVQVQPGDFDNDGIVDGKDFLRWQRGQSPQPWSQSDLAAWQANYGMSSSSTASLTRLTVPEPSALILAGLVGVILATVRRDASGN